MDSSRPATSDERNPLRYHPTFGNDVDRRGEVDGRRFRSSERSRFVNQTVTLSVGGRQVVGVRFAISRPASTPIGAPNRSSAC